MTEQQDNVDIAELKRALGWVARATAQAWFTVPETRYTLPTGRLPGPIPKDVQGVLGRAIEEGW